MKQKIVLHYPTLKTVLEVENVIKKANTPLSKSQIKKSLRNKVMHQTLNVILEYLRDRGMVFMGSKGIIWTCNEEPKFKKLLEDSIEV